MIPIGLDWDRPWQVFSMTAFDALVEKLTPSITGLPPDTSSRGVTGLHDRRGARTWRERALVLR